jgi:hypothetical protein
MLYAGTCWPNTTPRSVHEIRFKRPVLLQSFRIVCEGESPHEQLPMSGKTPRVQLGVEFFAGEHGTDTVCTALLSSPHRRTDLAAPSTLHPFLASAASVRCNYLVVRSDAVPLSLCLYGVEAPALTAHVPPPPWHDLPAFRHMSRLLETSGGEDGQSSAIAAEPDSPAPRFEAPAVLLALAARAERHVPTHVQPPPEQASESDDAGTQPEGASTSKVAAGLASRVTREVSRLSEASTEAGRLRALVALVQCLPDALDDSASLSPPVWVSLSEAILGLLRLGTNALGLSEIDATLSLLHLLAGHEVAAAALVHGGAIEMLQTRLADRLASAPLRRRLLLAMRSLVVFPAGMARWAGVASAGSAIESEVGGSEGGGAAEASAEADPTPVKAHGLGREPANGESGVRSLALMLKTPLPPLLLSPVHSLLSLATMWEATTGMRAAAAAAVTADAPATVAGCDQASYALLHSLRELSFQLHRHCTPGGQGWGAPPEPPPGQERSGKAGGAALDMPGWRPLSLANTQLLASAGLWKGLAGTLVAPCVRGSTLAPAAAACVGSIVQLLLATEAGALSLAADVTAAEVLMQLGLSEPTRLLSGNANGDAMHGAGAGEAGVGDQGVTNVDMGEASREKGGMQEVSFKGVGMEEMGTEEECVKDVSMKEGSTADPGMVPSSAANEAQLAVPQSAGDSGHSATPANGSRGGAAGTNGTFTSQLGRMVSGSCTALGAVNRLLAGDLNALHTLHNAGSRMAGPPAEAAAAATQTRGAVGALIAILTTAAAQPDQDSATRCLYTVDLLSRALSAPGGAVMSWTHGLTVCRLFRGPLALSHPFDDPPLAAALMRVEALVTPSLLLRERGARVLSRCVAATLQGRPPDALSRMDARWDEPRLELLSGPERARHAVAALRTHLPLLSACFDLLRHASAARPAALGIFEADGLAWLMASIEGGAALLDASRADEAAVLRLLIDAVSTVYSVLWFVSAGGKRGYRNPSLLGALLKLATALQRQPSRALAEAAAEALWPLRLDSLAGGRTEPARQLLVELARCISLFVEGACQPGLAHLLEELAAVPATALAGVSLLTHLLPPPLPLAHEQLPEAATALLPPSLLLLPLSMRCSPAVVAAALPTSGTSPAFPPADADAAHARLCAALHTRRALWSESLVSCSAGVERFVTMLAVSATQAVAVGLAALCIRLADLMPARATQATLVGTLVRLQQRLAASLDAAEAAAPTEPPALARVTALLAMICTHPAGRSALLAVDPSLLAAGLLPPLQAAARHPAPAATSLALLEALCDSMVGISMPELTEPSETEVPDAQILAPAVALVVALAADGTGYPPTLQAEARRIRSTLLRTLSRSDKASTYVDMLRKAEGVSAAEAALGGGGATLRKVPSVDAQRLEASRPVLWPIGWRSQVRRTTSAMLLSGVAAGAPLFGTGLVPTRLEHGWQALREQEARAAAPAPKRQRVAPAEASPSAMPAPPPVRSGRGRTRDDGATPRNKPNTSRPASKHVDDVQSLGPHGPKRLLTSPRAPSRHGDDHPHPAPFARRSDARSGRRGSESGGRGDEDRAARSLPGDRDARGLSGTPQRHAPPAPPPGRGSPSVKREAALCAPSCGGGQAMAQAPGQGVAGGVGGGMGSGTGGGMGGGMGGTGPGMKGGSVPYMGAGGCGARGAGFGGCGAPGAACGGGAGCPCASGCGGFGGCGGCGGFGGYGGSCGGGGCGGCGGDCGGCGGCGCGCCGGGCPPGYFGGPHMMGPMNAQMMGRMTPQQQQMLMQQQMMQQQMGGMHAGCGCVPPLISLKPSSRRMHALAPCLLRAMHALS